MTENEWERHRFLQAMKNDPCTLEKNRLVILQNVKH